MLIHWTDIRSHAHTHIHTDSYIHTNVLLCSIIKSSWSWMHVAKMWWQLNSLIERRGRKEKTDVLLWIATIIYEISFNLQGLISWESCNLQNLTCRQSLNVQGWTCWQRYIEFQLKLIIVNVLFKEMLSHSIVNFIPSAMLSHNISSWYFSFLF